MPWASKRDEYLLSREDMIWFWDHYLDGAADQRDPRAVPLHGALEGLPPLLVTAALCWTTAAAWSSA
jgi:acetyl esterase